MNLGFYKANISIINTKGNSFFLPASYKNYIRTISDMVEDGVTTRYTTLLLLLVIAYINFFLINCFIDYSIM